MALRVARDALPEYSCKFSRQDYTEHQLFAILVLKQFFKTDDRGIVQYLHDWPDLCRVLDIKKVPNYGTLCYAYQRLPKKGLSTPSLPPFSVSPKRVA